MSNPTIQITHLDGFGFLQDNGKDFSLSDFTDFLPAVGDTILDPGVLQGRTRTEPADREILTVVERVFNPQPTSGFIFR